MIHRQLYSESELLEKYGGSMPRYTSYPPVPSWNGGMGDASWFQSVKVISQQPDAGVALYVHLPYCEQLCTYCACNKRITVNHTVESPYIAMIEREWEKYREVLPSSFRLDELHLGGGTPTFFSPENLDRLMSILLDGAEISSDTSMSVEVHPNSTTREHLEVLHKHGFRRVSIGVQTFDPLVQKAINRIQSLDQVHRVTEFSREIGYTSVNYDIIYGLPFQSTQVVESDMQTLLSLRPDRIAHYGYAHVPWKHAGQRRYTENDLPGKNERYSSARLGRNLLTQAGYVEIGMDHYALPNDALARAAEEGTLHRNFMGYTEKSPKLLIGLGVSAISESDFGFIQNEKVIEAYAEKLKTSQSTFVSGHTFSDQDRRTRKRITDLMCRLECSMPERITDLQLQRLKALEADGIIVISNGRIIVNAVRRMFLRSVCQAIDPLEAHAPAKRYSQNL